MRSDGVVAVLSAASRRANVSELNRLHQIYEHLYIIKISDEVYYTSSNIYPVPKDGLKRKSMRSDGLDEI